MADCAREYISNVGEGVGCWRIHNQKAQQVPPNKKWRLTGSGFGGHFTRIEMSAESGLSLLPLSNSRITDSHRAANFGQL